MKYEEPLDIVNFLNNANIAGYCNLLARTISDLHKNHKSAGMTVLKKNEDYGFLMLDYGVFIYTLMEFAKGIKKANGNAEDGEKIAKKIEQDFLYDENETLAKNGRFFISVLAYHKLSFINKNNRSFYSKVLVKNEKDSVLTLINSISINSGELERIISPAVYKSRIEPVLEYTSGGSVAFGKEMSNTLKVISGAVKIHQFWSRDDGLNWAVFS